MPCSILRASLVLSGLILAACATAPPPAPAFALFEPVPDGDVFEPAIARWQLQHRLDAVGRELLELRETLGRDAPEVSAGSAEASPLASEYARFRAAQRRRIAEETVRWVQTQSGLYYRPDGVLDEWPLLGEVLRDGGDDCDGFDVLTFSLLRAAGFGEGEIYRAILRNERTDLHHMVTLWFETGPGDDPWVLDPTGEVSQLVRRLSTRPDWTPVRLFDERASYVATYSDSSR